MAGVPGAWAMNMSRKNLVYNPQYRLKTWFVRGVDNSPLNWMSFIRTQRGCMCGNY